MHATINDRVLLELDLREALEQQQLFLLYQPTFDLRASTMTGVEALLRWRHPSRGVLPPDLFIPIAEQNETIVPIGRWVLDQACRQAADWHARGHPLGISVNVSARQLDRDEFVDEVADALAASRLDPQALTLEITETALMHDMSLAAERLTALKTLGVRIAIDDFGTGYSSLAYLRQFPVDVLKIDRSFISGTADSKGSTALIHTLVQLGKTLGLQTLGEGIEDTTQLHTLQRARCDLGQGHYFAGPLPVEAIEQLFKPSPEHARAASVLTTCRSVTKTRLPAEEPEPHAKPAQNEIGRVSAVINKAISAVNPNHLPPPGPSLERLEQPAAERAEHDQRQQNHAIASNSRPELPPSHLGSIGVCRSTRPSCDLDHAPGRWKEGSTVRVRQRAAQESVRMAFSCARSERPSRTGTSGAHRATTETRKFESYNIPANKHF